MEILRNISSNEPPTSSQANRRDSSKQLLLELMIIGYLLQLIRERGTVLLPKNWQN